MKPPNSPGSAPVKPSVKKQGVINKYSSVGGRINTVICADVFVCCYVNWASNEWFYGGLCNEHIVDEHISKPASCSRIKAL